MSTDSLSRLNIRIAAFGSEELGWVDGKGMFATECSEANRKARAVLGAWMEEEGMQVAVDKVGNVIGILIPPGCDPKTPPVIVGSHIDTVPGGGRYDGRYGVLAGLEMVNKLSTEGAALNRPLVVGAWTAEESAYFQPSMPGSHATTHPDDTERCLDNCKSIEPGRGDDWTLRKALKEIGANGEAQPGFFLENLDLAKAAYIELHIEQGKILEKEGRSIAVVSDIYGCSQSKLIIKAGDASAANVPRAVAELTQFVSKRIEKDELERGTVGSIENIQSRTIQQPAFAVTFWGEGDHAGGRPMIGRHDAAYAAASLVELMGETAAIQSLSIPGGVINRVPGEARLIITPTEKLTELEHWKAALENKAKNLAYERGVTFTIRSVETYESATEATMTTDKRDIRLDHIRESERALHACIKELAEKYGVIIDLQQGTHVSPVHFDESLVALIKQTAEENPGIQQQGSGEQKGKVRILRSGPFHDAMKFGEIMPAAMIFVPSVQGISHDKAEFTHPRDLDIGVDVLTAVVRKLACEQTAKHH
ncbi:MAG: M20/M25/M40 family metallo-hydrolase [Williamsia sp.]|nr:M20/M25/M40 family metallo-hydrolase [Williamsia sp.]